MHLYIYIYIHIHFIYIYINNENIAYKVQMHHYNIQVRATLPILNACPQDISVGSLDTAHLNATKHKVWYDCFKWNWISLGIGELSGP